MAIEVINASKRFGDVRALDDVTVTFEDGQIYGLLGNNGAGKSTLMNVISGRLYPDAGKVLVDGAPVADSNVALARLFLMSEAMLFPNEMKVSTALDLAGQIYPMFDREDANRMAEQFGLNVKKKIRGLSTGYRSIFKLILALNVHTPYLLLDEPVLGLDAQHRDIFYKLLMDHYAKEPFTLILSTHLIAEAAGLIEYAVIIRQGRILKDLPAEELTAGAFTVSGPAGVVDAYLSGRTVLTQTALGGLKSATVDGDPGVIPDGLEISGVNLQDYFIGLMEKEDRT